MLADLLSAHTFCALTQSDNLLRRRNLQVGMARNGKEPLEAYHRAPPDLVLLDLGLPDM